MGSGGDLLPGRFGRGFATTGLCCLRATRGRTRRDGGL